MCLFVSVSVMWTYIMCTRKMYVIGGLTEPKIAQQRGACSAREMTADRPTDRQTHEEKRNAHQRFSMKRNVNVLTGEPQTFSVAALVQCACRNYLTGWFRHSVRSSHCTVIINLFVVVIAVVDRPIGNMFWRATKKINGHSWTVIIIIWLSFEVFCVSARFDVVYDNWQSDTYYATTIVNWIQLIYFSLSIYIYVNI